MFQPASFGLKDENYEFNWTDFHPSQKRQKSKLLID